MDWPLLGPLADDERAGLHAVTRHRRLRRGEALFHEGDPGETLHLVESGRLAVRVSTAGGETTTLSVLRAGDVFGELALISEAHERTASVVALEPCEVASLRRADLARLRRDHPAVEDFLLRLLARRIERLDAALLEARTVGVDRRVVRRLADLAGDGGMPSGPVRLPLTQEDLAGMAGTTRPTVNQVLQQLAGQGLVALGRGYVDVLDLPGLRRRSGR